MAPNLTVQQILSAREQFSTFFPARKRRDDPLSSLHRISIAILCGRHLALRNEIEIFWHQRSWAVRAIPEPLTYDRDHRALLAGVTYLLTKSFNYLIEHGAPRCAPAAFEAHLAAGMRLEPKVWEEVPAWAESLRPLQEPLFIPDPHGNVPKQVTDSRVDKELLKKNIVTFTLPILFA